MQEGFPEIREEGGGRDFIWLPYKEIWRKTTRKLSEWTDTGHICCSCSEVTFLLFTWFTNVMLFHSLMTEPVSSIKLLLFFLLYSSSEKCICGYFLFKLLGKVFFNCCPITQKNDKTKCSSNPFTLKKSSGRQAKVESFSFKQWIAGKICKKQR